MPERPYPSIWERLSAHVDADPTPGGEWRLTEGEHRLIGAVQHAQAEDGGSLPESVCHRCRGENRPWSAPSPLWNAVMRGGSIDSDQAEPFDGIICPACFMVLAEYRIGADLWRLDAERVPVELETVTPSGRVWDNETWLWRDRQDQA